jgi:hypothetical protein
MIFTVTDKTLDSKCQFFIAVPWSRLPKWVKDNYREPDWDNYQYEGETYMRGRYGAIWINTGTNVIDTLRHEVDHLVGAILRDLSSYPDQETGRGEEVMVRVKDFYFQTARDKISTLSS